MSRQLNALLLLLLFIAPAFSCNTTKKRDYLQEEYYNFLDPIMVNIDPNNPLYKLSNSYHAHNERFAYFKVRKREENIKAWQRYFKNRFTYKEIEELFYLPNAISQTAKKYKNDKENPSFSTYITFLDLQNKFAQNSNVKVGYKEVIAKGLILLKQENDTFIKERYLYLLMRLYHHHKEYLKVLDLYHNYQQIIHPYSPVSEWIDALRAGAYQHINNPILANQLYAQIFQNNKTNAHYGFYDFRIKNDQEWSALLATTLNRDKKALYHFLRAMKWGNAPIHELKFIAEIAPESIWFERLAYMIMQDLQNQRYKIMLSKEKDEQRKAKHKTYQLQKKRFLTILKSLKKESFFTLYAQLYLNLLDYNALKQSDLKRVALLANPNQRPYAKLLEYMYGVHQLSSTSKEEQHYLHLQLLPILPHLSKKQQEAILRYTALQISTLYKKGSIEQKLTKLFALKQNRRSSILKALNFENAKEVEAYINQEERSYFEDKVFKESMKSLERGDVAKILSTLYIKDNNFTRAIYFLRHIPKKNLFSPYNPFNATVSGNNRILSKKGYSQREFSETMIRLKSVLEKKPTSARDHFLYANGLYNKSWYGNFPLSSVFYRKTSLYKGVPLPPTTNLNEAQYHYQLALNYADNEEFKAKIAYQLLKIEFNRAISNTYNYDKGMNKMPYFGSENNGTQKIIKLLKSSDRFASAIEEYRAEYQYSIYGKEVIEKCITFRYFE